MNKVADSIDWMIAHTTDERWDIVARAYKILTSKYEPQPELISITINLNENGEQNDPTR